MTLSVTTIPILQDNYAYHISAQNKEHQFNAMIDPGEAEPIIKYIAQKNIKLDAIINTHYHWDHTDGNDEIAAETGAKIWAPSTSGRIKNITRPLRDQDEILLCDMHPMRIFATPGHTSDHVSLYFPNDHILITGDTLFSMGCGRIFDSTAHDLYTSLQKLKTLPNKTLIYPGHEYTQSNAAFALHIAPNNMDIHQRSKDVETLRTSGKATIPTTLEQEKKTNLFLTAENLDAFVKLRSLKDNF